ncbi:MAG: hypothetical protein M0Z38_06880 [Deltaproteobacteria bacterium]|nr:hypothetical protein [Deltaproteobacteria bacterium]
MAIAHETCLRCGREETRCICEIEFVHGPAYGEHRGSRMHVDVEPIDALFHDAAFRGFEPVTEGEKEALREKTAQGGRR